MRSLRESSLKGYVRLGILPNVLARRWGAASLMQRAPASQMSAMNNAELANKSKMRRPVLGSQ